MKFRRTDGYTERDLIHSAIDHLNSSELLFASDPAFFDSAGYLSHLGVELLLKSLLLHIRDHFPDSHSLEDLLSQIAEIATAVTLDGTEKETLELLNKFYTLRYPNPRAPVTVGDLHWDAVHHLANAIIERMPPVLQTYSKDPDRTIKGGRRLMARKRTDD